MNFLKSPESRHAVLCAAAISAAACIAAFIWNLFFGSFTLVLCAALVTVLTVSTHKRYCRISELAADIDRILHGNDVISLDRYSEGELSILQSEIFKMTVALREQQQHLLADKRFLVDSIADISHQIRTPLTSINLLVTLLSEQGQDEERREELVRELLELLSRVDWLINTLLKMSKLDAGAITFRAESYPLEMLIKKACSPLLVPIELRGQTLELSANGYFHGDVSWTCESLVNIIKNCMEHTPAGGTISIAAEQTPLYSQIVIADTGRGIAQDDLPHIFERFYKGRDSASSSVGIGLALSRLIIVSQNGTIKAENRPNGGSRFTLRFFDIAYTDE